jgi:hypothetical protein
MTGGSIQVKYRIPVEFEAADDEKARLAASLLYDALTSGRSSVVVHVDDSGAIEFEPTLAELTREATYWQRVEVSS